MINIIISTEYIKGLFDIHKDYIDQQFHIKNLRFVNDKLKGSFNFEEGPINTNIPFTVSFFSSQYATDIIVRINISAGSLEQIVSSKVASMIVPRIPIEGVHNNGGDIIIPITKWFSGASILQTEEEITINLRPY